MNVATLNIEPAPQPTAVVPQSAAESVSNDGAPGSFAQSMLAAQPKVDGQDSASPAAPTQMKSDVPAGARLTALSRVFGKSDPSEQGKLLPANHVASSVKTDAAPVGAAVEDDLSSDPVPDDGKGSEPIPTPPGSGQAQRADTSNLLQAESVTVQQREVAPEGLIDAPPATETNPAGKVDTKAIAGENSKSTKRSLAHAANADDAASPPLTP